MNSQKYCLQWNDFEKNISNSFSQLRQETGLFDVTLVSNDHQQVPAHRLVLSACSKVFKTIFSNNSNANMVLYLESVDVREVNLMLDYIYQGEVRVPQEDLDRFVIIANKFQLSGLLTDELDIKEGDHRDEEKDDYEQYVQYKSEEVDMSQDVDDKTINSYYVQTFAANNSVIDEKFAELIEKEGNIYTCTVCRKCNKDKKDIRRHLETHLNGLSYNCSICDRNFR